MTINGKNYKPAELTFNVICDLEDKGVSVLDARSKNMSLMQAYAAICMNMDSEAAGAEIQAHVVGGGGFDEIAKAFGQEAEKSDFFRALKEKQEKETASPPETESSKV